MISICRLDFIPAWGKKGVGDENQRNYFPILDKLSHPDIGWNSFIHSSKLIIWLKIKLNPNESRDSSDEKFYLFLGFSV